MSEGCSRRSRCRSRCRSRSRSRCRSRRVGAAGRADQITRRRGSSVRTFSGSSTWPAEAEQQQREDGSLHAGGWRSAAAEGPGGEGEEGGRNTCEEVGDLAEGRRTMGVGERASRGGHRNRRRRAWGSRSILYERHECQPDAGATWCRCPSVHRTTLLLQNEARPSLSTDENDGLAPCQAVS